MSRIIKISKEGLDLKQLSGLIPVEKVRFYTLKLNKDKTLKLYDKDKKIIKPTAKE